MIAQLIDRMRKEDTWKYFEEAYSQMQDEIIRDMRAGNIKTTEQLMVANSQLDLLERVKNLDSWSSKSGRNQ